MTELLAVISTDRLMPVAIALPLALALLASLPAILPFPRAPALRLLPLAPLPGLALALVPPAPPIMLPEVLLGVTLAPVPELLPILGMSMALWTLAGLAVQPMAGARGAFTALWALTLAGNVTVLLAQDVLGFYLGFVTLSLASWGLVIHTRTAHARAAGRVYLTLALLGEAALLGGLVVGVHLAGSLAIADVQSALATAPAAPPAVGLMVTGFGIKAGMVPLHIWLPLAHPAAPAPASAVLSGAIVKTGLVGLLVFLPAGAAAGLLVSLGAAGAVLGALWALTQSQPKAILAYSTVSQMGLMLMLVGAADPSGGRPGGAAADLALHHGLAKGALFLLVAAMTTAARPAQRGTVAVLAACCALSLIGAPLTGGALPKAAARAALPEALALIVTLTTVTTTMAMGWFMWRLWQVAPARDTARHAGSSVARLWPARLIPPALACLGALVVPWLMRDGVTGPPPLQPPSQLLTDLPAPAALALGLWPFALGLVLLAAVRRCPLPQLAPGDLLVLLRRAGPLVLPPRATSDAAFARWSAGGVLMLAGILGLALSLS